MSVKLERFSLFSALITFSLLSFSLSDSSIMNPDFTTLLDFKSSSDPSNSLSSWSTVSSDDPCSWLGITCDPSTHRVTKLVLNELNLTGSIQPLTLLTHLRLLSLQHNRLSSAPQNLSSWPQLKHLYLSHNLLAGKFPYGISHLRRLRRLDLSHNQFSGEIPITELTQLPHLLTLKLEFNSFTGTLNSSDLSSISITDLNVSGNRLSGKIPISLSNFPVTSFAGNKNLCGKPLPSDCPKHTIRFNQTARSDSVETGASGERKKGLSNRVVLMIISVDVVAVMATLVTVTCCCYKRGYRKREVKKSDEGVVRRGGGVVRESEEMMMVCFEGCKGFRKVDELLKASAEMLGKGSVGTTYKVVMGGGDVVVVKRVRRRERRKRKEVDGFLKEIGGLRPHPNVVSLRAYYYSKEELLLVYDFLPNASLHSLLHGNRGPGRTPLEWTRRLKLASGSAQGLAYLHSHNHNNNNKRSKFFHGHLTTSNIIVDQFGNACISDIGLHQLFPTAIIDNNNYNGNKFSQKCDVYSFGVVLLEILTGKIATSISGGGDVAKWVRGTMREKGMWEVLDFELLRYREMEAEMVALLEVALLCLAESERDRPKMGVVEKMIEDIMKKGGGGGGGGGGVYSDSSPSSLSESTPNFTSS
ncbi:hypothetical protein ACSBR2_037186 [Camellia fascicularis]